MYQSDKDGVPFSALIPQFKTETALVKGDIKRGNSQRRFLAQHHANIAVIFANCLL